MQKSLPNKWFFFLHMLYFNYITRIAMVNMSKRQHHHRDEKCQLKETSSFIEDQWVAFSHELNGYKCIIPCLWKSQIDDDIICFLLRSFPLKHRFGFYSNFIWNDFYPCVIVLSNPFIPEYPKVNKYFKDFRINWRIHLFSKNTI